MAQFATIEDLNHLQSLSLPDADPQGIRLLEIASSLIQAEIKQTVIEVTGDEVTLSIEGKELWLPERPVTGITELSILRPYGGVAEVQGLGTFTFEPQGRVTNDFGRWNWPRGSRAMITYDHGYADGEIPDVIIAVTCAIAGRALENPTGSKDETLGPYATTYAPMLTQEDKDALAIFRVSGSMTSIRTPAV